MTQYKGYYIDGSSFKSKKEIDEHIKKSASRCYKILCELFATVDCTVEMAVMISEQEERMICLGFTREELGRFETEAYKTA